ncbi:uncharacterized protein LOC114191418 [Vigna unguiculata]|uniref:Ubiquitin-like domain-containing protein n=1 Tax=Vigna unguiculata TaxID=3917 RepID=A0A4D6N681_VIGUN|nr:uncharacterized protein LOC114191418 [Vigna unguiculata]QCE08381.1 hypothetical protein DEO72_LG9g3410 [Vigna unguiculata]
MDDDVSLLPPRLRWRRQWKEKKTVDAPAAPSEQTKPVMVESPTEWSTIVLEVKVPASKERVPIEMHVNDTVLKLKEKVLEQKEMFAVAVERVVLQWHEEHVELQDEQLLKEFVDFDELEIDVYLKPPPRPPRPVKLKLLVVPMNSKEKEEMDVRAEDRVSTLREWMETVAHRIMRFRLPALGGYVFIHNERTMDEKRSYRWHDVKEGDTIRIVDANLVKNQNTHRHRT